MEIVAGLSLKNLKPRVWDPKSPYHIPDLRAVMVSYADFQKMPSLRAEAMRDGLRVFLSAPENVKVYLDNGAFYFLRRGGETPRSEFRAFVRKAKPDWQPIPQDYIPTPDMSPKDQRDCLRRTMRVNREYHRDGYAPVIHASELIGEYVKELTADIRLATKPSVAVGGLVPNLLRASKARPYAEILAGLRHARQAFEGKHLHLFGVGGTATLHIAALLGVDSTDSSGWRNRAARGIVQLPGSADRVVADLGNWRGRRPSEEEWKKLSQCACPACRHSGVDGLRARGVGGFCNRATHNLWTLIEELKHIEAHLADGTYASWYSTHLDNTVYRPLIDALVSPDRKL